MSTKQTYFQTDWLEKEDYKNWLKPCIDKKLVFCQKCRKTIELSNMGEQTLKPLMKGKKHRTNSKPISCFFQTKPVPVIQAVETGPDDHPGSSGQPLRASTNQKQMTLRFNLTDSVDKHKAEIMWVLKCLVCDWSINSAEKISDLFKVMFSDSQTASEFEMICTKLSYLINFGIALHFCQFLVDKINCCSFFTMSSNESLNKMMQTSQMDLIVRFWNTTKNQVSVWYWDSKFLGHARADNILAKSNDSMSTLDPNKMIQVSLDGLSTNSCRLENEQSQLIEIGSCGLHIIHRAYKTGTESTDWELKKIFKGTFTLLHDSPARRNEYILLTGSNTFPVFLCNKVNRRCRGCWLTNQLMGKCDKDCKVLGKTS